MISNKKKMIYEIIIPGIESKAINIMLLVFDKVVSL